MTDLKTKGKATDADIIIGEFLKDARKSFGSTQAELADKIGITFQQLQKYEHGTNRITLSRLFDVCDALGFKSTDFIHAVETSIKGQQQSYYGFAETEQSSYQSNTAPIMDNDLKELLKFYHAIENKEDRQIVLDMAKRLSGLSK